MQGIVVVLLHEDWEVKVAHEHGGSIADARATQRRTTSSAAASYDTYVAKEYYEFEFKSFGDDKVCIGKCCGTVLTLMFDHVKPRSSGQWLSGVRRAARRPHVPPSGYVPSSKSHVPNSRCDHTRAAIVHPRSMQHDRLA